MSFDSWLERPYQAQARQDEQYNVWFEENEDALMCEFQEWYGEIETEMDMERFREWCAGEYDKL